MEKSTRKDIILNIIFWAIVVLAFLFMIGGSLHAQTKSEVYKEIIKQGIKHPDIVMAQARLETGNFTSGICKRNNNLFGMKLPKQRRTTAIGESKGHARYNNWKKSVEDYKIWQDTFYKEGDYYIFLESHGYATSNTYISKLKQF